MYTYCIAGVISQETFLFTGTIRDNLDVRGLYSDTEVLEVLQSSGILETFCQMKAEDENDSDQSARQVTALTALRKLKTATLFAESEKGKSSNFNNNNDNRRMPKNLDGVLDIILVDKKLSQGQKQLLSVARILLNKPQFVLLDEASSSLDPLSEARMYSILQKYLPQTTTLLAVNHRYERSVIQELCPQVLELRHGQVVRFDNNEITLSHDV